MFHVIATVDISIALCQPLPEIHPQLDALIAPDFVLNQHIEIVGDKIQDAEHISDSSLARLNAIMEYARWHAKRLPKNWQTIKVLPCER